MSYKVHKQLDYVLTKEHKETPRGVSETIPDMSYSIKDIIEKYTQGIPLPVLKNGSFDNVDNFEEIDVTNDPNLDLSEATAIYQQMQSKIKAKAHKKTNEEIKGASKPPISESVA